MMFAAALGAAFLTTWAGGAPNARPPADRPRVVVLISADAEWKEVVALIPDAVREKTPFGEWFERSYPTRRGSTPVVFFHGGWGKVAAAGSTQYAIDRWHPRLLINLGTCGGFVGDTQRGDVLLVTRTIVYDIVEQMGDSAQAIAHYTTDLDSALWPKALAHRVRPHLLVSADRDIVVDEIPRLRKQWGAIAADWESGAIAYTAAHNGVKVLILRGVSDMVGPAGGEAYGNLGEFASGTRLVMTRLLDLLAEFLRRADAPR